MTPINCTTDMPRGALPIGDLSEKPWVPAQETAAFGGGTEISLPSRRRNEPSLFGFYKKEKGQSQE